MSSLYRFLSFVPPALFFALPLFSQVQGKLEQIPGTDTYQVSLVSTVNWLPPNNVADQGQITLRAISGEFQVSNFQTITGDWVIDVPNFSPTEAPGFDYFSFQLQSPTDFNLVQNGEFPLFSFENGVGRCTYIEIINDNNDPFLPPNSQNANIGNFVLIIGSPVFNSFEGNSGQYLTDCPPLVASLAVNANPVPCFGDDTFMDVTISGGLEPYQVDWVGVTSGGSGTAAVPDFGGSTNFSDLPAGKYAITVTDARDSILVLEIDILQPDLLEIEIAAFDASCNGSFDGVAFVDDVDGGTVANDYQYYWNTNPTITSQSIGFLNPGPYSVTVVDDNGCTATGNTLIGESSIIIINEELNDISCFGAYDGVIDLYPVSPSGPFTFEWSTNVATGPYSSAWQLGGGTFNVTVTDNTGVCTETATYSLIEPDAIEVDYRMAEPDCFGDKGFLEILAVSNAMGSWKAEIIGNAAEILPNNFEVEPGTPMRLVIEDSKGCKATEEFLIPARQEIFVELGEDHSIKYGQSVALDADIYPGQGLALQWIPTDFLSCADCPAPESVPTQSVQYRLVATDANGCSAEDRVAINVRKSRDIYIPTAFSPNHDGINDVFCPFGGFEIVSVHSMQVFDRWGGMVYSNNEGFKPNDDLKIGWDGTAREKIVVGGTYLYTMNVEFIDGEIILYSGEVNLLR